MKQVTIIFLLLATFSLSVRAQGTVAEKARMAEQFLRDMYKLNKAYRATTTCRFSYEYNLYSDSAYARLLKSFPLDVIIDGRRSYYRYPGIEILYDSSFTLIINHDEKNVSLLALYEHPEMAITSMIDTARFKGMMEQVKSIAYQKKSGLHTYTITFTEDAYMQSMHIAFEDKGLIRELWAVMRKQGGGIRSEEPVALKITRKSFRENDAGSGEMDIMRYFRLFGNGKYVLSVPYQTYKFNNLYEQPTY